MNISYRIFGIEGEPVTSLLAFFGMLWAVRIMYAYTIGPFVRLTWIAISDKFNKDYIMSDIDRLGVFKYPNKFMCYKTKDISNLFFKLETATSEVDIFPTCIWNTCLVVFLLRLLGL